MRPGRNTPLLPGRFRKLSARARRKLRNRAKRCDCEGYHFPHRIGSKASHFYRQTYGTVGCIQDGVPF